MTDDASPGSTSDVSTSSSGEGNPLKVQNVDVEVELDNYDVDYTPSKDPHTFIEPPDGGWGWFVCFASFWTNGTLFGILNIFGILYVELLEEFKDEGDDVYFKLSWIGSLQIATTFFMSMFSGILVDQFGIQLVSGVGAVLSTAGMLISSFVTKLELLYLTYGIIVGLGSSLLYTPSMSILGHYFKKHLGIVNGLVAFGSAVFTLILGFALPVLLKTIGLRHSMRVLSGVLAVLIICPFIWRPLITSNKTKGLNALASTESIYERCGGFARKVRRIINVDMFKNKGYVVWIIGLPIAFMGYFIPFVHIVKHTKEVFPSHNPEILVTCIGGVSGVSRLVSGKLADSPNINRVWIQQISFVLLGVATSLIPFAGHYGLLIGLACLMGIGDGCFICMLGPIAYDLLGPHGMGQGLGIIFGIMSVPMTAGPPLAGWLRGLMGTYKIAFLIAGIPPILGACILFFMPPKAPTMGPVPTITEAIEAISRDDLDRINSKEAWYNSRTSSINRSAIILDVQIDRKEKALNNSKDKSISSRNSILENHDKSPSEHSKRLDT